MPKRVIPKGATPRQVAELAGLLPGSVVTIGLDVLPGRSVSPRTAARYLCIAAGVDRQAVRAASLSELVQLVNSPAVVLAYNGDAWPGRNPADEDSEEEDDAPAPAPAPAPASDGELLGLLRRLIGTPQLDESRVVALIHEHATPVTRVEVKTPDDVIREVGVQHEQFPTLLKLIGLRQHVYLHGPAGSGKSTAAAEAARALGLPFGSTGKVDSKYDLLGFRDAHGRVVRTPFRETWESGGVFLFDELDRSDPQAVVALNNGLATGAMDFVDGTVRKHADTIIVGGGNTTMRGQDRQYTAAQAQDASVLERFALLAWGYDERLELALSGHPDWVRRVQAIRRAVATLKIDLIVSPRASISGAKLLEAGFTREETEHMVIWKGLDSAMVAKILANVKGA